MACAPTSTTAFRCVPRASYASSNTRRAATYSGSGRLAPGILDSFHLLDQRFGFLRSASGTRHQIRHDLTRRRHGRGELLGCRCEGQGLGPLENDGVVWLEQPNVGAGFGRNELERFRGSFDIVYVEYREPCGSDPRSGEAASDGVPAELRHLGTEGCESPRLEIGAHHV